MVAMLGEAFGYLIVYALFALVFKHKAGFIITSVLCIGVSISQIRVFDNFSSLLASIIAIAAIYFIVPLQVRSEKKNQWEQRKK